MKNSVCSSCHDSKANLQCAGCHEPVCKSCVQFVDEETFSFLDATPAGLSHGPYCYQCFDAKVQPEIAVYEELIERAKKLPIFTKDQGKETRLYKRAEQTFTVAHCVDREETVLRLAFQAVRAGFEMLIDVDLFSKKVKDHAFQKAVWFGTGVPAYLLAKKAPRQI